MEWTSARKGSQQDCNLLELSQLSFQDNMYVDMREIWTGARVSQELVVVLSNLWG